jgi:hypothetical protein
MPNVATTFRNTASITAREAEVPDADFSNGCNNASNSPGVGIATANPNLTGNPEQWTLLDQFGDARTPQIGQLIGGPGYSDPGTSSGESGTEPTDQFIIGVSNPSNDGTVTVQGTANLATLAAGWVMG